MQTETPRKTLGRRIFENPWAPLVPLFAGVVFLVVVLILSDRKPEMTPAIQARDQAAVKRAQAWLEALGFEPGPAICRSSSSGSAWCTVRVEGTDKTYSLFCSWRHPNCIENRAAIKW